MSARALLVDVSNNQGHIEWELVAGAEVWLNGQAMGQVEGALIKASEGTHFVDSYCGENQARAKEYGLAVGFYHFIRADLGTDPTDEALTFWGVVSNYLGPGDNLILDIEDFPGRHNPPDLDPWVTAWAQTIQGLAGFPPGFYSTSGYLQAHNLTGKPHLANNGLWLASWYDYPPAGFVTAPPAWEVAYLWQFTSSATVAGVGGHVDANYCNGDINIFRAYGAPGGIAAPPPPREPLDQLYAAQLACRPVYTQPADQRNLDGVVMEIDDIKGRYGYDP